VIEAVQAVDRPFYVGVQWHPERTADDSLGFDLIHRLVCAAR
jgi:gamma-glutamyl-gamma-aminobutyrate hydrolase PuuD